MSIFRSLIETRTVCGVLIFDLQWKQPSQSVVYYHPQGNKRDQKPNIPQCGILQISFSTPDLLWKKRVTRRHRVGISWVEASLWESSDAWIHSLSVCHHHLEQALQTRREQPRQRGEETQSQQLTLGMKKSTLGPWFVSKTETLFMFIA